MFTDLTRRVRVRIRVSVSVDETAFTCSRSAWIKA